MIAKSRQFEARFRDGTTIRGLHYEQALALFDQHKGTDNPVSITPSDTSYKAP